MSTKSSSNVISVSGVCCEVQLVFDNSKYPQKKKKKKTSASLFSSRACHTLSRPNLLSFAPVRGLPYKNDGMLVGNFEKNP